LTYSVAAETQTPEQFAVELAQLTDVDVDFVWSFTGRYGPRTPEPITVTVPLTQIRNRIGEHWSGELDNQAVRHKENLMMILNSAVNPPREE